MSDYVHNIAQQRAILKLRPGTSATAQALDVNRGVLDTFVKHNVAFVAKNTTGRNATYKQMREGIYYQLTSLGIAIYYTMTLRGFQPGTHHRVKHKDHLTVLKGGNGRD